MITKPAHSSTWCHDFAKSFIFSKDSYDLLVLSNFETPPRNKINCCKQIPWVNLIWVQKGNFGRFFEEKWISLSEPITRVSPGGACVVLKRSDNARRHPGDIPEKANELSSKFRFKCKQISAYLRSLLQQLFYLSLRHPCAENCGWGGFSTFPRWRSRVFLIESHWPPSDFWCASFGKYWCKPF